MTIRHPENDNAELLWHCGVFPPQLAEGPCYVDKHFTLNHTEGICACKLQKGTVTVGRFDGIRGEYSLFCGEGDMVDGPFNSGTVSCVYGNYKTALKEATRFMDGPTFDPAP